MRITDTGFKHIISLGRLKESSQTGIYLLYSWEGVDYYCGSKASEKVFNQSGVFIELSLDQLELLPKKKEIKTGGCQLEEILKYYESSMFLEYFEDEAIFKTQSSDGVLINLRHLTISSDVPSPFRIVEQTKTPFHGFYSPLAPLNDLLSDLGVNTQNLWITATPVIRDNVFKGVLVGMSSSKEYGLDSLEMMNTCVSNFKAA